MQVTLVEKLQNKVISFQQTKTWISNLSRQDKALHGTTPTTVCFFSH